MFRKIILFFASLQDTVKQAPIEIGVTVLYWVLCMANMAKWLSLGDFGATFPICFGIIYSLNRFTAGSKLRWLYYASLVVPLLLGIWQVNFLSVVYWLSLLFSQLLVVYSRREFENNMFVREGVKYLCDMASALCLATVCFLMAVAIFYSTVYIFDLERSGKFMEYSALTAYLLLGTVFFLVFNTKPRSEWQMEKFTALLVNFILTPALLVYMGMLYLYFGKIAILWSLPKGGVSYMVISFIVLIYGLRAIQPMLLKRYYGWFYDYFSWWTLPALAMLWVGTCYRIGEYGLTENRLYLLLGTVALTFAVAVSFGRFRRDYAVVTAVSALLFALFTYIPGISAKDIGVGSQLRSLRKTIVELNLADASGKISHEARLGYDDKLRPLHKNLYETFRFLEREKGGRFMNENFGVKTSKYVIDTLLTYDLYKNYFNAKEYQQVVLFGDGLSEEMDIRKYSKIERLRDKKGGLSYLFVDGVVTLEKEGEIVASVDMNQWLRERMTEVGLDPKVSHSQSVLQEYSDHFMVCDGKGIRLILTQLTVDRMDNSVVGLRINYVLSE